MSFLTRRAKIKVRFPIKFPSNVTVQSPLVLTKTGALYEFSLDTSNLWTKSEDGVGIYSGAGAPTITAAQGSLYLRSDGSGANDMAYVNTDGGSTWTPLLTIPGLADFMLLEDGVSFLLKEDGTSRISL